MFNKPKIDLIKIRDEAYEEGYRCGRLQGLEETKVMIEKRALDLYTNQNYLVNPNHIFQVTKDNIPYLNQEPITRTKANELQLQAKMILGSEMWDILTNLIRQKAVDLAVKTSQNWDNVFGGKMMVHNISLMEHLIKYIAEIDINKIPQAVGGKDSNVL